MADVVLQRARNELGATGMDIFHVSCEQFALRCKTGSQSTGGNKPAREVLPSATSAVALAAGAAAGTVPLRRLQSTPATSSGRSASLLFGNGHAFGGASAFGGSSANLQPVPLPDGSVADTAGRTHMVSSTGLSAQPVAPSRVDQATDHFGTAYSTTIAPLLANDARQGDEDAAGPGEAAAEEVGADEQYEDVGDEVEEEEEEETMQLAGTESEAPRSLEGASKPRKEVSAMALSAGFEVYGVCREDGLVSSARKKRAQLLLVLQSRAVIYADANAASTLRELLLSFLDGGGYHGAGYPALRSHAQRKLAQVVQSTLEYSVGPLAVVESGQAMLVPLSRRLAKKFGDLLQIAYVAFDWQPSSLTSGSAHSHGIGCTAHFASDLQVALQAFSHGLVFESADLAAAGGTTPDGSPITPDARGVVGALGSPSEAAASPSSAGLAAGSGAEEVRGTLHLMRMLTAALHLYLETHLPSRASDQLVEGAASGSTADETHVVAGNAGATANANTACTSAARGSFAPALRERLSLALMRGGAGGAAAAELDELFESLRARVVPLDVLHALCRADVVQQAALASVRQLRQMRLREQQLGALEYRDPRCSSSRQGSYDSRRSSCSSLPDLGGSPTLLASGGHGSAPLPVPPLPPGLASVEAEPVSELIEAMLLPLRPAPGILRDVVPAELREPDPRPTRCGSQSIGGSASLASSGSLPAVAEQVGAAEGVATVAATTTPSPSEREASVRPSRMLQESIIIDHF